MWFPLLVLPLVAYDAVAFGLVGADRIKWSEPLLSVPMASGALWSTSLGDLLIFVALMLLMLQAVRAVRSPSGVAATFLSGLVFALYLGQFLVIPAAGTSLFFTCLAMSFVDLVIRMFTTRSRPPKQDFNY